VQRHGIVRKGPASQARPPEGVIARLDRCIPKLGTKGEGVDWEGEVSGLGAGVRSARQPGEKGLAMLNDAMEKAGIAYEVEPRGNSPQIARGRRRLFSSHGRRRLWTVALPVASLPKAPWRGPQE
jgi:hypothetical protein